MNSKSTKINYWVATIIIVLMEAVMPIGTWLFAPQYITEGTKALNYPDYFAYALIIAKPSWSSCAATKRIDRDACWSFAVPAVGCQRQCSRADLGPFRCGRTAGGGAGL